MSSIQWTDVTDNIIVVEDGGWWCRVISEGCRFCYAAALNQSGFFGGNKLPYTGNPPKLKLRKDLIDGWKRQRRPKKHFVASMTDVFGDWVPFDWAVRFLRGMWAAPHQTFQVLTKRPDVALDYICSWLAYDGLSEVPGNIWIGVSVENQKRADERIPLLLLIPAKVRFLSVEPMLGPIVFGAVPGMNSPIYQQQHCKIDWVIFGGESGPNARRCQLDWIRDGVAQCKVVGVPVFVKQLGANVHRSGGEDESETRLHFAHKKGGDLNEWPEDLRVREWPTDVKKG